MNPFVSVVNQRQVYADLLVQQARQASGQQHLQQALLQSAAMQLEHAYRFYLGEVGASYQCRNPEDITSLWQLIANLQLVGKNPAETSEIYYLIEDRDSWLCQLQACCRAFASLPEMAIIAPVEANRIPAISTAQRYDWSRLSCDQVQRWHAAFSDLVERQRQAMVEC